MIHIIDQQDQPIGKLFPKLQEKIKRAAPKVASVIVNRPQQPQQQFVQPSAAPTVVVQSAPTEPNNNKMFIVGGVLLLVVGVVAYFITKPKTED